MDEYIVSAAINPTIEGAVITSSQHILTARVALANWIHPTSCSCDPPAAVDTEWAPVRRAPPVATTVLPQRTPAASSTSAPLPREPPAAVTTQWAQRASQATTTVFAQFVPPPVASPDLAPSPTPAAASNLSIASSNSVYGPWLPLDPPRASSSPPPPPPPPKSRLQFRIQIHFNWAALYAAWLCDSLRQLLDFIERYNRDHPIVVVSISLGFWLWYIAATIYPSQRHTDCTLWYGEDVCGGFVVSVTGEVRFHTDSAATSVTNGRCVACRP